MTHEWVTHENCETPYCFICEGGLALCKHCGGLEGALPTECPGVSMTQAQIDAVYAGKLDYRNGQWMEGVSNFCPVIAHTEEPTP